MSDGSDDEGRSPSTSAEGGGSRRDDPLDPSSLPCLFWDDLPDNPDEHPDYMALQAIAEECTPEERAENYKVRGSRARAPRARMHACLRARGTAVRGSGGAPPTSHVGRTPAHSTPACAPRARAHTHAHTRPADGRRSRATRSWR
jgi:hypothetical protein